MPALLPMGLGAAVLGYPMLRVLLPPSGRPAQHVVAADAPGRRLLCLGDSITHGHLGADWVGALRGRVSGRGIAVINGGVNGQLAYNVGRRLDAALACRPTDVVLLIGTNDVMAAERPARAAHYRWSQRLPRTPDLAWSEDQLAALVARLVDGAPRVALCTVPPLGASADAAVVALVDRWNDRVRALAVAHGIDLLDVHAAITPLLAASDRPYDGRMSRVVGGVWTAAARRDLLGTSWDAIAARAGWGATVDGVHLSDAAGARVGAQVEAWLDRAPA